MSNFFTILVFHYIADFICQTRYMGRNKSKSIKALASHILSYGLVLSGFCCMFNIFNWYFILINVILHFVTDFITSKMSSYCYKNMEKDRDKYEYMFWAVIGFDQLIHNYCLYVTYEGIFNIF